MKYDKIPRRYLPHSSNELNPFGILAIVRMAQMAMDFGIRSFDAPTFSRRTMTNDVAREK